MNGGTAFRATWAQQFAIAGAYAACYELARHVSFSHWILPAGLRLACMLLMPRRYWVALAMGETLPVVESALMSESTFGAAWALSASTPIMLLCMAWMLPLRRRWHIHDDHGHVRMGLMMTATLGCALITAVATTLTLVTALTANPGKWPEISVATYFWAYLLGAYLGALTLTPCLLALRERADTVKVLTVASIWRSRLLRDLTGWAVPMLGGLAWLAMATQNDGVRQLARLAILLPVLAMTVRHGWHGSAIGGMFASIALAATGTALLDPAMIRSQVMLALLISGCLLTGARITRHAGQAASAAALKH
ncbi:MASE1 domain-containing protein [Luteibacter aegosomatissinici]|uniref:MASE1 domain-containing protein n=1 Tax=Luteibacter aegosomatissinici TaxID=2911539 RepID=UPI001FF74965|nr:MASE1 domain-containing protein [Luteibacter aegosomatissinici]UPG95104.1 MASE1 domain-containing protein [Luteibacter aegosomatissinici]